MKTIIIEGSNATGKTTLANHIAIQLSDKGYRYNKLPRAKTVEENHQLYSLVASILSVKAPIVFDRVPFISDLVYPAIHPGGLPIAEVAEDNIRYHDPILIFCFPPIEVAFQNYVKRNQHKEFVDKESLYFDLETKYKIYQNIANWFPKAIKYNYLLPKAQYHLIQHLVEETR